MISALRSCLACALALLALALLAVSAPVSAAPAERQPVLRQIDLPHNYYFREMYLPQLTSGPSAVAFMPDGQSLVYSMQGSLWQQRLDSTTAVQLTAGPGYDYQPDVAPDGKRVVFTRYDGNALELQLLDLATGTVTALTSAGAVNCEPRWSPDGTRIAWVSTAGSGHFRIFVGTVNGGSLQGGAAWPERKSTTPRVYYSAYDHEISPSWSPDGKELAYVSNPEAVYGTGSIWRRGLARDAEPQLVREEETTWRARPDWSLDGKRIVYASYAGRNWHQLWLTTAAANGYPLALTYGEYDATGPRWSADGHRIAYLSNSTGDLQIHVLELPGARDRPLSISERKYRKPMGQLVLHVSTAGGTDLPSRISIRASDGRSYAPADAWIRADDQLDRSLAPFEIQYFHSAGRSSLSLPAGPARITVWRGLETAVSHTEVTITADQTTTTEIRLEPLALPEQWRNSWHSADVHVHMNYAGTYRDTPERLVRQAEAEDLDVVFDLIVNKEQRVPDISYFLPHPDPASNSSVLLSHGQEFHTGFWGHLGLLGLNDHILLPGLCGLRTHGSGQPLSHQCHGRRPCPRAVGAGRLRAPHRSCTARPAARHRPDERTAGGRGPRQGRLLRSPGLHQQPPRNGRSLAPDAELRLPAVGGRGHGCHGQFRLAPRPGGHEPRIRPGPTAGQAVPPPAIATPASRTGSLPSRQVTAWRRTARCWVSRSMASRRETSSRFQRAAPMFTSGVSCARSCRWTTWNCWRRARCCAAFH